jgi:hypothetical protein
MIISLHFLVVVRIMPQIFSCFVRSATEVNQIAVIVRYMTGKWVEIAVMAKLPAQNLKVLQHDALEQHKKGQDAEE